MIDMTQIMAWSKAVKLSLQPLYAFAGQVIIVGSASSLGVGSSQYCIPGPAHSLTTGGRFNTEYRKVPIFSDARKLCCNLPKIQERGETFGYFIKKMQME